MKELVFLPDRDGRDELGDAAGFVRMGASAAALGDLAARLTAPSREKQTAAADETLWRSALALALLTDVWAGCGTKLSVVTVDETTSAFASWVLASRPETERGKPMHLLLLERSGARVLLGLADEKQGVILPAQRVPLTDAAPERAAWIDREKGLVSDPAPFLNEKDRTILLRRMAALGLSAPAAVAFREALENADAAEVEAVRMQEEAALERLAVRMEAVCGLKDFDALSFREEPYATGGNALLRCLDKSEDALAADAGECRTWLWNSVPFARSSRMLGLTGVNHPCAEAALEEITSELTIMSGSSVRWNNAAAAEMQRWLDSQRLNAQLLPQARARLEASCALLKENGQQVQSAVTLTWPWNASSGAVRALLMEALGESWLEAAANPFSDCLTKLTGHVLGDTALESSCACADGVLLPPLSQSLSACVARAGLEGGLAMDTIRFTPREDGGITASFLLRGAGEVLMSRTYGPEEILVLEEAEAPTVAVWPCLPMADWRAYHVFVRGNVEVSACRKDGWTSLAPSADGPDAPWRCLSLEEYPGSLSLLRDGLCLGALPNLLPEFRAEKRGDVVVGVDLGSSQTTTAFAWDGVPGVLEGAPMTRLLVSPQELPDDGFLGGLTPASIVPTAVVLTGPGERLFVDGYAYRPGSLQALAAMDETLLRSRLKWRSDVDSVRARRMLLHQVMLGAALTATAAGATSVSWRLTIADDMGDEGRMAMLDAMGALAIEVEDESGLRLTAGVPAVQWAEESMALISCLRAEGNGRGSCVALDLGSGSTKAHLWLMNQNRPAAGAVVFEGVQDALLRLYRQQPVRLLEDLADSGDESLLQDVLTLVDELNPDYAGPRQADKLSLMLDMLLDTHRTVIGQHLSARAMERPTHMQSVMLETAAAALYSVGLMLAQAGENTMQSHLLPQDMSVCLTGRGAWLLDTLPHVSRSALERLTHLPLRLEHPVRFITLRTAASPAQSVAMGLTVTREMGNVADAPIVRTRESFSGLMQRLMLHLCAAFPMHMWLLHEGLYDYQTGALTLAGEDSIRRAAALCYDEEEEIAPMVTTFVRLLRENPILPDSMIDPGA